MFCLMVFNCRKGDEVSVTNGTFTCSGSNPTLKEIYEASDQLKNKYGYDSVVLTNVIPLDYEYFNVDEAYRSLLDSNKED